jgi:hypothetical protein
MEPEALFDSITRMRIVEKSNGRFATEFLSCSEWHPSWDFKTLEGAENCIRKALTLLQNRRVPTTVKIIKEYEV